MRIRSQLLTLLAIPLVGLVSMGLNGTWERIKVKRDADDTLTLTGLGRV